MRAGVTVVRRKWAAVCLSTVAVAATDVQAADWSSEPWADVRAEYNDNILLIPNQRNGVMGGMVNAGVRVQRSEELGFLRLAPSLRSTRYDTSEPLDSNEQLIDATWSRRSELGQWRVDANWTRDTTLTSELEITGLVQSRKRRVAYYVAPSYKYAVTPRNLVGVDLVYTSAKYEDADFTGLVDYTYLRSAANWGYQWSERTVVSGILTASRMEAEQINNTVDSTGAQLQLNTNFSERWDGTFSAGLRHSKTTRVGTTSSNGWLADARMNRKDDYGAWRIGLSRTVDPSGIGTLVQRDQLTLAREQALSPLWHLSASVYAASNQDVQTIGLSTNRDYRNSLLKLSRLLTPAWSAELSYSYDWQQYTGQTGEAERSIIMLGVRYDPKPVTE